MEAYTKGPTLGTGTFASVFMATHKETGEAVAVKKINITDSKEGVHVTALREMKLLREIHHPNVIELKDVFSLKKNIALVLPFMESDLEAVIRDRLIILSPGHIKSYMKMLLSGLHACHSHWVVHRDVKPNNCLLAADGTMKLADFGLARTLASPERDKSRPYTHRVFARWYRAPELLYCATSYGFSIDIWAAGCIFAELLLRRPWLPGTNDIDQLGKIFQALGTPDDTTWPDVKALPAFIEFQPVIAPPLRSLFPSAVSADALDLLSKMMSLNPAHRPTAAEALAHSYFSNDPLPTPNGQLPKVKQKQEAPVAPEEIHKDAGKKAKARTLAEISQLSISDTQQQGSEHPSKRQRSDVPSAADAAQARAAHSGYVMAATPGHEVDVVGKFSPQMSPPVRT